MKPFEQGNVRNIAPLLRKRRVAKYRRRLVALLVYVFWLLVGIAAVYSVHGLKNDSNIKDLQKTLLLPAETR